MPKGKTNASLKSWVAFVKKIQKDENITYPEAMKRASIRKSEWKRGGSDGPMPSSASSSLVSSSATLSSDMSSSNSGMSGGRKKRTKKNKKSRKSRKSRKSKKRG